MQLSTLSIRRCYDAGTASSGANSFDQLCNEALKSREECAGADSNLSQLLTYLTPSQLKRKR